MSCCTPPGSASWLTASQEFAHGIAKLEALARDQRTAIMCAEALWWQCHRRLIADVLTVHVWRVEHLGVGHAVHQLPRFAVVGEDGSRSYPAAQASLLET